MGRKKKLVNKSGIPDYAIEQLALALLPDILDGLADEEVQREFAQWQAQQETVKTKKSQKTTT